MHAHQVIARLPAAAQRIAFDAVMRFKLAPRFKLFQMFMRTLEEIGLDRAELEAALARCRDLGPSFVAEMRALAHDADTADPRASYRAAVYALLADWATHDLADHRRNYELAIPHFERFAIAHVPRIERVRLPFGDRELAAYLAIPDDARGAVLFVPGNEPKEWLVPLVELACGRGLAALVIDLPGYGESLVLGTRLDGRDALARCGTLACDLLASRGITHVATFGVSLGGLLAHVIAALEPRVVASAGIGGPFDLPWLLAHIPCVQRDHLAQACGGDPDALVRELDLPRLFAAHQRPARVIHGTGDEVVPARDARKLVAALGPRAELRLVDQGDHMANPHLRAETDAALAWFLEVGLP